MREMAMWVLLRNVPNQYLYDFSVPVQARKGIAIHVKKEQRPTTIHFIVICIPNCEIRTIHSILQLLISCRSHFLILELEIMLKDQ